MNITDDIADVACALRKRTTRPSVWGEKLKEAERKTRASFVSVFGGSSVQAKSGVPQDAPKPTATASAQNADDGAGQAAKEPQGATADALAAKHKANGKHGKKGGKK